jgi:3-phenylpropionate/trans-cinnamate dioxygenase ferredoxin reductase subunit
VVLTDGTSIDADLVVVGVGIEPASELAERAGITVDNGIVVDQYCRTSIESVYAAGEVADHPSLLFGRRVRLESWQNAQDQAVAAARSMLGDPTPYRTVPWFWSDQYDINLQIAGRPEPEDVVVYRGEPETMSFCAFYLRHDVLVGVIGVNRRKEVRAAMKLIEQQATVAPVDLADDSLDVRKLARVPATR